MLTAKWLQQPCRNSTEQSRRSRHEGEDGGAAPRFRDVILGTCYGDVDAALCFGGCKSGASADQAHKIIAIFGRDAECPDAVSRMRDTSDRVTSLASPGRRSPRNRRSTSKAMMFSPATEDPAFAPDDAASRVPTDAAAKIRKAVISVASAQTSNPCTLSRSSTSSADTELENRSEQARDITPQPVRSQSNQDQINAGQDEQSGRDLAKSVQWS